MSTDPSTLVQRIVSSGQAGASLRPHGQPETGFGRPPSEVLGELVATAATDDQLRLAEPPVRDLR
jgi:hypothetical protein